MCVCVRERQRWTDKSTDGRGFRQTNRNGNRDKEMTHPAVLMERRPQISQLTWHHPPFPPNARFYVTCVCHYKPSGSQQAFLWCHEVRVCLIVWDMALEGWAHSISNVSQETDNKHLISSCKVTELVGLVTRYSLKPWRQTVSGLFL